MEQLHGMAALLCLLRGSHRPDGNVLRSNQCPFTAKSVPLDQVSAKLDTWLLVHNFRIALAGIASALGVLAPR
jgi:hypothetical protein